MGQFGKFDNLDQFFTPPEEFGSKMNAANDDTFKADPFDSPKAGNPGDAFGIPNDDMPF
jgi:replicative DNA helicase